MYLTPWKHVLWTLPAWTLHKWGVTCEFLRLIYLRIGSLAKRWMNLRSVSSMHHEMVVLSVITRIILPKRLPANASILEKNTEMCTRGWKWDVCLVLIYYNRDIAASNGGTDSLADSVKSRTPGSDWRHHIVNWDHDLYLQWMITLTQLGE